MFFPLEQNQCHLKTEVELDQLYIDFELAVLPADGGESSPQFEKATTKHLNSLMFMLEVNLRMDLFYVYYS